MARNNLLLSMSSNPMKWIALLTVVLFLTACSGPRTVSELTGVYTMSIGDGLDSIELAVGGTYRHTYTIKNGRSAHQSGTWHLEILQAGQTIVLNDFRPLLGERTHGTGTYLLLIKTKFGKTYLITNIDLDSGYTKKS